VGGGVAGNEENKGGATSKSGPKKTSRFRVMRPAPLQKTPQISPIFISDKVALHVSREKDGKLRLGYAGMGRYEGRSAWQVRASLRGVEGWILPPWQEER
jgi:hypothetical protein